MHYPSRWKKITVDQSKVLKNRLFPFFVWGGGAPGIYGKENEEQNQFQNKWCSDLPFFSKVKVSYNTAFLYTHRIDAKRLFCNVELLNF